MILRDKLKFWMALSNYVDMIVRGTSPLSLPDAIANSLSYVKAFGGTEQRNLPDGYIERQFIYMMDGSYLLTDIVPTPDCKIEFDFQTLTIASGARTYLGCRDTSGSNDGLRVAHISSGNFRIYGFGTYTDSATAVQSNTKYKFVWNNKQATITTGGTTVFDKTFAAEGTNQTALAINGWNTAGTVDANPEGMYFYSLKIWDNQGNLIADYVPAVQKGTVPVVGLYDTVSKTFKTATAGTFAAGGEAVPTPDAPMDIVSNNGVLKHTANIANVNAQTVLVGYYVSASGVVSFDANNWMYQDYIPVSPNTTYTLTMSSPVYFVSISEYSTASDSGFIVRDASGSGAHTQFTITTGANTNFIRFGANLDRSEVTFEKVLAINWMLNKGNSIPYTPYGPMGVYTDGTVETINVHSKNLFDVSTLQVGYIKADGTFDTDNTYRHSGFIPVTGGTTYTESGTNGVYGGKNKTLSWYAEDYSYISSPGKYVGPIGGAWALTAAAPANAKYVVVCCAALDTDIQVELGSTATEYEPYYDGGTATAEMLLKVGDYQDVQSIIDGVVTRNVGVKVLDGTEDWTESGTSGVDNHRFSLSLDPLSTTDVTALCTHISRIFQNNTTTQTDRPCIRFSISGGSIVWYEQDNTTTLAQFKQWLADQYAAGTPVTVVYPLATATTESVAGQTLQVTDGDNTLEITQASMTGLELEAKYKKEA